MAKQNESVALEWQGPQGRFDNNTYPTMTIAVNEACRRYNERGFSLVGTFSFSNNVQLIFEKTSTAREDELFARLQSVNELIEKHAKGYVETSYAQLKTDILNYLGKIPNDIMTDEYRDAMQGYILEQVNRLIIDNNETLRAQLLKEIRDMK